MTTKMFAGLCLMIVGHLFSPYLYADSTRAIRQPGIFVSTPRGSCTAKLTTSSQGGFLQLYIGPDQHRLVHVADDVTGIAWTTSDFLVYSVSPVYGRPGIFLVACREKPHITKLVSPKHIDNAYPQGSDYFELYSVIGNQVQYYYGDDVDKMDVALLHSDRNIREVHLPGGR
jgi:hypothetical protein